MCTGFGWLAAGCKGKWRVCGCIGEGNVTIEIDVMTAFGLAGARAPRACEAVEISTDVLTSDRESDRSLGQPAFQVKSSHQHARTEQNENEARKLVHRFIGS